MENDELAISKDGFETAQSDGRGEFLFNQVTKIMRNSGIIDKVIGNSFNSACINDIDFDENDLKYFLENINNGDIEIEVGFKELVHFSCTTFRFGFWAALMAIKYGELDIDKLGK